MDAIHAAIAACYALEVAGIALFILGIGILATGRWSR